MNLASASLLAVAVSAATAPSPQDVVGALFDAFNRHDVEAMARLYVDDASLASSDFCRTRVGRGEVMRTYRALFAAYPDLHDEIQQMVVQGDTVAVRFVAQSALAQPPVALPIASFLTVKQGLIRADISTFDTGGRACES